MTKLRHPLNGAIYELQANGLIKVDDRGTVGVFRPDGRHESGKLTQADLHILGWMSTREKPTKDNPHPFLTQRAHRG
jgi:hypothetical protein